MAKQANGGLWGLTGYHVQLIPLTRRDYDFVFDFEVMSPVARSYRFAGMTPSPERFPEMVWSGVLVQYVIVWRRTGARIGTAMCYGADFKNRYARIGGALLLDAPSPYSLEGFAVFLDHLFTQYDLRKVYGESLEPNTHGFYSAIGSIVHEEGRLREHEYFDGAYHDLLNLAIYRDEWLSLRASEGDALAAANERLITLSRATRAGDSRFVESPLARRLRLASSAKLGVEGRTRVG